jgi:hypothetical protein
MQIVAYVMPRAEDNIEMSICFFIFLLLKPKSLIYIRLYPAVGDFSLFTSLLIWHFPYLSAAGGLNARLCNQAL